ncbi:hypothetical protein HY477_02940 [Candidatus Uhrbacteria bacterium]|nr:hypothetical protein [Candidatus Uhrbacteria bacterium]
MSHYICTGGCGGVADKPGTCQAEDCNNWGEELEECECADGQHLNHGMPLPGENAEEE